MKTIKDKDLKPRIQRRLLKSLKAKRGTFRRGRAAALSFRIIALEKRIAEVQ